jgi:hypothetical protein
MIWYSQSVACKDNPPTTSIMLKGEYNHPPSQKPLICIYLIINSHSTCGAIDEFLIYSKNPAMLAHIEEPEPEDVLAKYNHIIAKHTKAIQSKSLEQLVVKYTSKT